MSVSELKKLLLNDDADFWKHLAICTHETLDFQELITLSALRKKASVRNICPLLGEKQKLRLAILGGYNFYPFHEILGHLLEVEGYPCELCVGDFDNYVSEILDEDSNLYKFKPHVVLLMPSHNRCKYQGKLTDPIEAQKIEADKVVSTLTQLLETLHDKTDAEIILTNFTLPASDGLGSYRVRTLGSDWTFRKWVNLLIGLNMPSYVHLCDCEFLAYRFGGEKVYDARAWFESKQPCSPIFLPRLAREASHIITSLKKASKKILVLDLDNTLWGGILAEDGMNGIELGNTSPRGEAFKAFQNYLATLKARGILLGICSKNEIDKVVEVFEKHPEMVLKTHDIVSFKVNWEPKSENIQQMAFELNLGLDSMVFIDDNPAEIEIVRQFAPKVTTLLLKDDPSDFVRQLQDSGLFEPQNITAEDWERTKQYKAEVARQTLYSSTTDMNSYLASLDMEASFNEFTAVDIPRIAQLINKSNQFNLTTQRYTESDVQAVINDASQIGFSVRLKDCFGDHGLISVVILKIIDSTIEITTWLMSCRVLKRQVEYEVLNEIVRLAKLKNCSILKGIYLPTSKNEIVRDLYQEIGFALIKKTETARDFILEAESFKNHSTKIKISRHTYE